MTTQELAVEIDGIVAEAAACRGIDHAASLRDEAASFARETIAEIARGETADALGACRELERMFFAVEAATDRVER